MDNVVQPFVNAKPKLKISRYAAIIIFILMSAGILTVWGIMTQSVIVSFVGIGVVIFTIYADCANNILRGKGDD